MKEQYQSHTLLLNLQQNINNLIHQQIEGVRHHGKVKLISETQY